MYLAIIIIFLLIYLYCNNLEGFFNYDECNIRNSFRDKTCPKKWGVPPCNSWQKVPSIKDIEEAVVTSEEFTSIKIKDIANVSLGPATRRGILDKEGAEVV